LAALTTLVMVYITYTVLTWLQVELRQFRNMHSQILGLRESNYDMQAIMFRNNQLSMQKVT